MVFSLSGTGELDDVIPPNCLIGNLPIIGMSQYQQAEQYARIISDVGESLAANLNATSAGVGI